MRINKLQLAGLAAALIGAGAGGAAAEDVTISTSTTTPVSTSDPNPAAPVEAGNVTVAAAGSITVTTGQAAVTLDSNNTVTINGTVGSNNANNSTGILVTGNPTGTINNAGSITLLEDYTLADTDNDGDLDGSYASTGSTGRVGIWVDSGGFTGDITSANITVEGNNSAGIRIDGLMTGDVLSSGTVNIIGDNSQAIVINGGATEGVSGDVTVRGSLNVTGTGSSGVVINAPIVNGGLHIGGIVNVTGYHSLTRASNVANLDADDLMQGGPAVAVHFSLAQGFTVDGIGVEDDPDDDDDGITDSTDADDDTSGSIRSIGSAPAVLISADPSANLVLGSTGAPGGFGFHNRGAILADSLYDGFDATAVLLEGQGASTVTTAAGLANDNTINANAREAESYAIVIGQNVTVPTLMNRQIIASTSISETDQTSYGVFIRSGATTPTFDNSGILRAQLLGEVGDAVAIVDESGTLTTINNSGTIQASTIATDADPTDDVIPVAAGAAIAIDVRSAAAGVTINQNAPTPFTDDDAVDDDEETRPDVLISGDILLGAFADTINLFEGQIQGDIAFGAGADVFNIDNGAIYTGIISDSGNDLTLNVADGALNLQGGQVTISTATFGADGSLGVVLSETPADSTLITSTGAVTFAPGAAITAVVPRGLPESDVITFLTTTALFGGSNVAGAISGAGTSYVYNLEVVLGNPAAADGAANSLALAYNLKSAAELGLNNNQATAFDPVIDALRRDEAAAQAFVEIDNEFDFFDAYEDLLPTFSSAATELAATAIQQMQSATTNRLAATRLHDLDEVSAWAQEIAYGLTREPPSVQGQEFRGHGFGLAAGIDGPLNNGGLFGVSASFITSEMEEPGRPEGEVSVTFGQLNAYYGTAVGPIDLDFVGGLGAGKSTSRRFVEIGDTFTALSEADWWSFEGHGAIRASMPMRLSNWMVVSPQAALTYVGMSEQGYTEEGGGAAIDYEVGDAFSQRLWGDVGVEFQGRLRMRGETVIAPRIFAGYRANLIDEEAERDFRFASGGPEFTLIDESYGDGGALFGVGIDATNGYSTFTLGYEGEFGDQIERHSLNASIRFRF